MEKAIDTLMAKMIICVLEVHDFNLKSFLRYQLSTIRPKKKLDGEETLNGLLLKSLLEMGVPNYGAMPWKLGRSCSSRPFDSNYYKYLTPPPIFYGGKNNLRNISIVEFKHIQERCVNFRWPLKQHFQLVSPNT